MSHARETTLLVDFLKNPSIMPLGIFLVLKSVGIISVNFRTFTIDIRLVDNKNTQEYHICQRLWMRF